MSSRTPSPPAFHDTTLFSSVRSSHRGPPQIEILVEGTCNKPFVVEYSKDIDLFKVSVSEGKMTGGRWLSLAPCTLALSVGAAVHAHDTVG